MLDATGQLSSNAIPMGTKTPNAKDRRVQRTDQRLRDAFASLIHERAYTGVTIRDVTQRAGVGRSTFYTHFGDLEEMHGQWLGEHLNQTGGRRERPALGFTRAFLEHAHEQRRIWRDAGRTKEGAVIRKRLRQKLVVLVRDEVGRLAPKQRPAVVEGIVHYIAGAFAELLFWWIDSPTTLSPAELDVLFHRLTASALDVLKGKPSD